MEDSERSKFTPAGEIANERLIEAVADSCRYPEGTSFIGLDEEHFSVVLAETVAENRPLAIFYPDGMRCASHRASYRGRGGRSA